MTAMWLSQNIETKVALMPSSLSFAERAWVTYARQSDIRLYIPPMQSPSLPLNRVIQSRIHGEDPGPSPICQSVSVADAGVRCGFRLHTRRRSYMRLRASGRYGLYGKLQCVQTYQNSKRPLPLRYSCMGWRSNDSTSTTGFTMPKLLKPAFRWHQETIDRSSGTAAFRDGSPSIKDIYDWPRPARSSDYTRRML